MHRQVLSGRVSEAFCLQRFIEGEPAVPITINANAAQDAARGKRQRRCGGAAFGRSGLEKDGSSECAIL